MKFPNVKLTGGFWKKVEDLNKNITINAVYDRFYETGRFEAMSCSWTPESDFPKPHVFWDSDVAKWIEGASYIMAKEDRPDLLEKIESVIDAIEKNQLENGYYNSYFITCDPENIFSSRHDHELYCAGHLTEAAIAYFEVTGRDRFLKLMEKYMDCIEKAFIVEKTAKFTVPGHEEIEIALLRLYRCTKNEKYLDMCKFFINMRGNCDKHLYKLEKMQSYDQNRYPVRELSYAEGHSVRALYLYTAMADLAKETGDKELLDACKRLFYDIVNKKMYITGGIGSTYVGETFTIAYDLPSESAYTETCAGIALVFFMQKMLENEINSEYADVMERVLYNGVLSGISHSGNAFFYENPLEINISNHNKNTSTEIAERLPITQRVEVFNCSCCPPNLNRLLSSMEQYIYGKKDGIYYVHQFMESTLSDGDISISQTTNYPENGKIKLSVCGLNKIAVRIPAWCENYKINREYTIENGYAYIDASSDIEIEFEMKPILYCANAEVNSCTEKGAVMYGPVLYCVEGIDNDNVNLHRLYLTEDLNADISYYPDLDTNVITVDGFNLQTTDKLYAPYRKSFEPTRIKLIPYRLFANRGEADMLVWLNVK